MLWWTAVIGASKGVDPVHTRNGVRKVGVCEVWVKFRMVPLSGSALVPIVQCGKDM